MLLITSFENEVQAIGSTADSFFTPIISANISVRKNGSKTEVIASMVRERELKVFDIFPGEISVTHDSFTLDLRITPYETICDLDGNDIWQRLISLDLNYNDSKVTGFITFRPFSDYDLVLTQNLGFEPE